MDTAELSPRDKLAMLHELTPAENRRLAAQLEDALRDAGQEFELSYLQAGEISIDNASVRVSVMIERQADRLDWREYVPEQIAESMVQALEAVYKHSPEGYYLNEIVITDVHFANPHTGEPVNGVTLTDMDDTTQNSIVLFANALSDDAYRGQINGVPHIQGTVAHEYGHCLDNASQAFLQTLWVEQFPWEYHEETDTFSYTGDSTDFVTSYAAVSPGEDLAESYALFVFDPQRLEKASPERKAFFDTMLT